MQGTFVKLLIFKIIYFTNILTSLESTILM